MRALRAAWVASALAAPADANPGASAYVIPVLPVETGWIAVELRPGAPPPDWLAEGYPASIHGGPASRIWRLPAARWATASRHASVARIWGMPPIAPPPADLEPPTPDFEPAQRWLDTLGVREAAVGGRWPGAAGDGVALFVVEYDWDAEHEDLAGHAELVAGSPLGEYRYHGNATLGIAAARDDRYGTVGAAPAATVRVVHPILGPPPADVYDVAWALDRALDLAEPGDVVLIEQQAIAAGLLVPVSVEPGVAAVIRALTDRGVVVIEPAANGSANLDDPDFADVFSVDHGSWMVGAARAGTEVRSGFSGYGSPVDLYADGDGIAAPSSEDGPTDLFFPDSDPRQAYTAAFGGTSGASAQVAGLAVVLQGASIALHGEPVPPRVLLTWVRASGTAQDPDDARRGSIGVRPSLHRTLRAWIRP